MRIALLTDSHLAAVACDFVANAQAAIAWVNHADIDLVIHCGDLTADAVADSAQIDQAAGTLAGLRVPLLCVPGNHDVGDSSLGGISHEPPLDAARLAMFRRTFGADWWLHRERGWSLVGIDTQLFGSGGEEERAQWRWLAENVAGAVGPTVLFLHKPWFRDGPGDHEAGARYVPAPALARLNGIFSGVDLRLVVSGHVHQQRRATIAGVEHVWLPSTAFVIPDRLQETIGAKLTGVALLTLGEDRHQLEFVRPPGMRDLDLTAYRDVYPQIAAMLDK